LNETLQLLGFFCVFSTVTREINPLFNAQVMKMLSLFAAAALFGASVWAEDAGFIRKTFNVAPGGKLTIRADRGSIDVKTGGTDKVEIEVTRDFGRDTANLLEKHHVTFSQDGNNVTVKAELDREAKPHFWNNMRSKVHYDVTVPEKYNVNLHTAGGSISIKDLEGEANAETSGGGLRFGQIKGQVYGRTSGGSIHVNGATQNVDVETSGGGIHVGDTGGNVMARTSGGSIHLGTSKGSVTAETSGGGIEVNGASGPLRAHTAGGSITATIQQQPDGPCTLETSGGGIDLKIADSLKVDLEAHTSGGSVTTDLPVTVQGEVKKNALRSKLNGGGPKLTMATSGGSIHIRKF
jgi:DUF4097 and DUF4098 domain-containing protein YvlB